MSHATQNINVQKTNSIYSDFVSRFLGHLQILHWIQCDIANFKKRNFKGISSYLFCKKKKK